jgi:hypothetical protein
MLSPVLLSDYEVVKLIDISLITVWNNFHEVRYLPYITIIHRGLYGIWNMDRMPADLKYNNKFLCLLIKSLS